MSNPNQLWKGGPVLPTEVPEAHDYTYEPYESRDGLPMWACYRKEGGISGYGMTMRDALNDYLDKTDELVPDQKPRPSRTIHTSAFEPPTFAQPDRDESDDGNFDTDLEPARE